MGPSVCQAPLIRRDSPHRKTRSEAPLDFARKLARAWDASGTSLCVGLDPIVERMPAEFAASPRPVLSFNRHIIELVGARVCAFKPQAAHHGALAAERDLADTIAYIRERHPHALIILDAKRGDIVGERTFGEGSVQKTIELPDGAAILLTVAKYQGPAGKKIQDEAVTPTVAVGHPIEEEDDETAPAKGDQPLDKALQLLKAKAA